MRTPKEHFDTISVTRYAAGTLSATSGLWTEGATSSFDIIASVQPVTKANELIMFPEGEREKEWVQLITETELFTIREEDNIEADHFEWKSKTFKIRAVRDYNTGTSNDHFHCFAVRVNQ